MDNEAYGLPPEDQIQDELENLQAQQAALSNQIKQQRQVQSQMRAQQRVQQSAATPMDEIEYRLNLSTFYKAVLEQPLFGDDSGPFAATVEQEVRQFILGRLGDLLGTNKPKVEVRSQFTDTEAKALKLMAQRLITPSQHPKELRVADPEYRAEPQIQPVVRPTVAPVKEPEIVPTKVSAPTLARAVAPKKKGRPSKQAAPVEKVEEPAPPAEKAPMPVPQRMNNSQMEMAMANMAAQTVALGKQMGLGKTTQTGL